MTQSPNTIFHRIGFTHNGWTNQDQCLYWFKNVLAPQARAKTQAKGFDDDELLRAECELRLAACTHCALAEMENSRLEDKKTQKRAKSKRFIGKA